ncbi:MAG: aminotransferase class I/II-fold pyridoxal phosphate-dependent enzyme [Myxococcota bacterium]|jgi:pyridoxal phosphate-dependent aminotransferase EpsN|nr:aminotransferase class I/II-fold pyridoxal phosphate-dependent enzyme [Myxococcota bacterium]
MARIYLSPPHMGSEERALLLEAFDSNWIAPLGPMVDAFERELAAHAGVAHVAALASGTSALHLALLMLGVGPGDEVLVPSLTFSATANAVRYVGAQPVFLDVDERYWVLDPALLAEDLEQRARQGRLPKAVLTVDLYGQLCPYAEIEALCARYELPLLEDAAEALGASYQGRQAGSFGVMSAFSFNGNKIITTSGGGALASNDERWIRRARFLATQAREPAPHYQHEEIGYNYRLSNLLAAVGRGQLRVLEQRVAARRAVNQRYRQLLTGVDGLSFMQELPESRCSFWLTCLTIDEAVFGASREQLRLALEREDIESRPVWKPMHLQPVFRDAPCRGGAVSARLFEHGLCLPSGSALTPEEQERIVSIMLSQRRT